MTLEENKKALVEAHRNGDWETAAILSQEKQRLRKKGRCEICGERTNGKTGRCQIHHPQRGHRERLCMKIGQWIVATGATAALIILAGCASKPQPAPGAPPSTNAGFFLPKAMAKALTVTNVSITTNIQMRVADLNNPLNDGVASYRIYQGGASRQYTNHVNAANTNTWVSFTLASGTYFFAATAVSTNNSETAPTPEVSVNVPFSRIQTKPGKGHK